LRDYFNEGNTFADFLKLVDNAPVIVKVAGSKTQNSQKTKAMVSVANAGQLSPSGKIILDVNRTLPSAEIFIQKHYTIDGVQTIYFLNGEFYTWKNNAYKPIDIVVLRGEMLRFLDNAVIVKDNRYKRFPAKKSNVDTVIDALQGHVVLSKDITIPHWLGSDPTPVADLSMVICFKTENLDLTTMRTFAPTPKLFNYSSLDFDYDPNALCPAWDKFLDQLWGNDTESKETLMMFIGLLLVRSKKLTMNGTCVKLGNY